MVGFKETISFALADSAIEHPIDVVGSIMEVTSVEITDSTKTVVFGVRWVEIVCERIYFFNISEKFLN